MTDEPIDLDALASRILRPDRGALVDVRAAVAGLVDPREAWLRLAHRGLIPSRWTNASSCRFIVTPRAAKARSNHHGPLEKTAGHHTGAFPASVTDAIALAASAASASAAEDHAREAARRVGVSSGVPVLWRIESRWRPTALRWKRFTCHNGFNILGEHGDLMFEISANARRIAQALREASGHNGSVEGDVRLYEFWRVASTTAARVPPMLAGWEPWGRFVGERFADVPNPLDPWLRVWALGFGVDEINQDAIVLVAPHDRGERPRAQAPSSLFELASRAPGSRARTSRETKCSAWSAAKLASGAPLTLVVDTGVLCTGSAARRVSRAQQANRQAGNRHK